MRRNGHNAPYPSGDVRDARTLIGMPIFTQTGAEKLGRVKDVVFDPERHAVLGFLVHGGGPSTDAPRFVELTSGARLGADAIIVEDERGVMAMDQHPRAHTVLQRGIHILGSPVVTSRGERAGKVTKILIHEDGSVARYQARSGMFGLGARTEILPWQIAKIGPDAIMIDDPTGETATPLERGALGIDNPR